MIGDKIDFKCATSTIKYFLLSPIFLNKKEEKVPRKEGIHKANSRW